MLHSTAVIPAPLLTISTSGGESGQGSYDIWGGIGGADVEGEGVKGVKGGEVRAVKKLDPGSFSSWRLKQLQLALLNKILNIFFVLAGNVFC